MKRFAALGFIILVCLMSSACSYIVNFVVVNETDAPIEIEYTLSLEGYSMPEIWSLPESLIPAKMDLSDWKGRFGQDDWQKISQNEYQCDSKTGKCKVIIAPQQALKIVTASDNLFYGDNYKHFQITNLEINGESGKVTFEGLQLFKQFSEKNYSNRFIAYK